MSSRAVPSRSGTAYACWVKDELAECIGWIEQASLDPFRADDGLRECAAGRAARHGRGPARVPLVKPGTQVVDEVRRRVEQHTQGGRGHKDDPLYTIRGLLRRGREHLSDKQIATLNTCLQAGDPDWEVTLAWNGHQQLRSMYQATDAAEGRRIAEHIIEKT